MKHSCDAHCLKDHHGFVQCQWELHIGVLVSNSHSCGTSSKPSRNSSNFCPTYAQDVAVVQVSNENRSYLFSWYWTGAATCDKSVGKVIYFPAPIPPISIVGFPKNLSTPCSSIKLQHLHRRQGAVKPLSHGNSLGQNISQLLLYFYNLPHKFCCLL